MKLWLARPEFSLGVDLKLPARGITAVFGPSGSGKTTLLRCVAGLERANDALVRIGDEDWQDDSRGVFLPVWRRPLGYVFQEASLFDHLDVRGNLDYGRKRASEDQAIALDAVIELLGIGHLLARRTSQLSGGERQRVAIARGLAAQPRILLLDEPLASLDHARRQEILPWLEKLRDELRIPMLYVTHSAAEVARLADTLVVLNQGKVVAAGPVAETLS
ncbi:MAG: molybdenum ABC transporter ATP-binding protein, partial [Haliea sp.]